MKHRYFYLVELQYLGYRYHGWQKQPGLKTIEKMVERTVRFVLEQESFKVLVTGRTDAMVSATQTYFELFLKDELDTSKFLTDLNWNLPSDIRAISIKEVDQKFNVINDPKEKEYNYHFSFGSKNHPFAAPFICCIQEQLNLEAMIESACLFEGTHDFRNYCYKPSESTNFSREIVLSEIVPNEDLRANFFPEKSYTYRVRGKGFMRHQVRMMMGALFSVGKGELNKANIQKSLSTKYISPHSYIAPASGLMLKEVDFE